MKGSSLVDMSGAAIVCVHVAEEGKPILLGFKDEPTEPVDSGWQFLCGHCEELVEARIWTVREILQCEPTLRVLWAEPPGTVLSRTSAAAPWKSTSRRDGV